MDHFHQLQGMIASAFEGLGESRQKDDWVEFSKRLKDILPDARRYITDRMNSAEQNGRLVTGHFNVDELIHELSQKVYYQFHEISHRDDLRGWLIAKADALFEDAVINLNKSISN